VFLFFSSRLGCLGSIARWIGIVAAALGAISAIILVPYYPVWSLIYIALAVMVIYGLSAHFDQETSTF